MWKAFPNPDAERVLRDLAGQATSIFGTTFGYMESIQKIAGDLKDVKFEHARLQDRRERAHLRHAAPTKGAYMAGVIAGAMTKSNTLGVVGSVPIPEVIRNINSFTLGAQSVNPKIKTKVVWVNRMVQPTQETEAATSLINGGADVLFQNTDSPAVPKDGPGKGKRALWLGQRHDRLRSQGPPGFCRHQLGSLLHQGHQDALEGNWKGGESSWWGVKEGAIDIVSIAEDVPAKPRPRSKR